eukprot:TRINITY_DN35220_c0_g1_i4.p1 TRINITY_DN35220_c0_g1~~TRINITY_DN35220_c0_g1_i4.p1  ORF type:complete len:127 (+),score=4.76 TRINITY_DN35220_c0_g1_i4:2-382(+)
MSCFLSVLLLIALGHESEDSTTPFEVSIFIDRSRAAPNWYQSEDPVSDRRPDCRFKVTRKSQSILFTVIHHLLLFHHHHHHYPSDFTPPTVHSHPSSPHCRGLYQPSSLKPATQHHPPEAFSTPNP